MNENKLFVSILRNSEEDESAKLTACYFCKSAVLTVNPEYHWIRQLKIQSIDPYGVLRNFMVELTDLDDVTIESF